MALPIVVIEIAPPDAAVELESALERGCSEAVARGRCEVAHVGDEPVQPDAIAIVSWQDAEQQSARVQVGLRRDGRWLERTLSFEQRDAPVERWRAVGLAIATLVGELPGEPGKRPVAPAAAPTAAPPRRDTRKPAAQRRAKTEHAGLAASAGALAGPGLDRGPPHWGAWAGAEVTLADAPWLFELWASYAVRPADENQLSATWIGLQAGAGWRAWQDSRLIAELHAFFRVQQLAVRALHPVTDVEDTAERWSMGPGIGLRGLWLTSAYVGFLAGIDVWALPAGDTPILILGRDVASQPAWGAALRLGGRIAFL